MSNSFIVRRSYCAIFAALLAGPAVASPLPPDPCDINQDGVVSALDIEPFCALLTTCYGCHTGEGDLNSDGTLNDADAPLFIACLQTNGASMAPDRDGDGLSAGGSCLDRFVDNCPLVYNPGQEDADSDGIGDACEGFGGRLYVDRDAPPPGDVSSLATSWATALYEVRDAIDVARQPGYARAGSYVEIWVADGLWTPSPAARENTLGVHNDVRMFGGFDGLDSSIYAGGETSLAQRDIAANLSVLSGDIDGNDGGPFSNTQGNSYHVVTSYASNDSALLDGFTITAGNADASGDHANAGGYWAQDVWARVSNCRFVANSALSMSGMGLNGANGAIANCVFIHNRATAPWDAHGGGGLGCGASLMGGATNATVRNCTFSRNTAAYDGNAVLCAASNLTLINCVLWGNDGAPSGEVQNWAGTLNISYCDIEGNAVHDYSGGVTTWGAGNTNGDPGFADPLGPDTLPGTLDDDLRLGLWTCSAAIDAGDNAGLPADAYDLDADGNTAEPLPVDATGGARFFDDPFAPDSGAGAPPIADMGAYEFRETPAAAVQPDFVTATADVYCTGVGGTLTLTASGGSGTTLEWRIGSCDGDLLGTGSPLVIPQPEMDTTYFARWVTGCDASACASAEVTVFGLTSRVSVDSAGGQANNHSYFPSISADGRYVAFYSPATNLVPGDTNGTYDVFVHDRQTGQTTRVSVDSAGGQANNHSFDPSISADGRYVAFYSPATNLVPGDTNGTYDEFVHDRQTGQTTRVSVDSAGGQANSDSLEPSISADGRYVAFYSPATNLVPGDTNGTYDVFVHDRQTGQTTRVSVDSAGGQANSMSFAPSISADGRYVAFSSYATNLVAGDTNGQGDVFVHDRQTGQTTRVSLDSAGGQADSYSYQSAISGDGRYVAFFSYATNLVAGDTNGQGDVFVHDRQTGQTARVSVDSAGGQANSQSHDPSISADGRYVAFQSWASNLVPGDFNNGDDIFVHDRQTGQTTRVSVEGPGGEANPGSSRPSISGDGRYVAFDSVAYDLVVPDTNGNYDIFVRDRFGVGVSITQHPQTQNAALHGTAQFNVVVSSNPPGTYQWRRDVQDLSDGPTGSGSVISGATTNTLTITNVQASDVGLYDVVFANACFAQETSNAAGLTLCPCDVNCDGTINPFDIQPFVELLGPTPPTACSECAGDTDGNGTVNPFDINAFLACLN